MWWWWLGGGGLNEDEEKQMEIEVKETGNSCKPTISEQLQFLFLTHLPFI